MSESARLTFREVVADSGLSERTVRYYIHEGLVPPAIGRGRSAYYTPAHMQRLARIRAWQAEHRSLDEMRQLLLTERAAAPPALDSERWTRIRLHDDLELHVRRTPRPRSMPWSSSSAPPPTRGSTARLTSDAPAQALKDWPGAYNYGREAAARAAPHSWIGTVQSWRSRNITPPWRAS